ncbi:hypothetical protein BG006_008143 [Podila minutissima]|uniref:Protein rds1 n=1 Tax=Podila minutissima TaxID=64525 RepID=A0A9P5SGW5_9FUNG|nr:hypothetical protein BG006_008143 [Podila minutissima]
MKKGEIVEIKTQEAEDRKRDTASDIGILNFALSLEHLESEFYKQGLAKYKREDFKNYGYDDKNWERIEHISKHEATHVTFLTSAIESLQGTPLPPCEYKFPLDSLESFLTVAQALEHTGTSAELLGHSGVPYSFDTPLNTREVIIIASNFVTSCPFNLAITPFTQLTATLPKKGDVKVETWFEGEKADTKYWCQLLYNDKIMVSPREECAPPATVVGYVYVVITDSSAPISLSDDSTIVAGPALLFNRSHDEY